MFETIKERIRAASLRDLTKACAAGLGLIAFFLMFADQVKVEIIGFGRNLSFSESFFGEYGAVISFIGYLLIGIASLALIALFFLQIDEKKRKYARLCLAVLFLLGAVFVFIVASVVNGKAQYNIARVTAAPVFAGIFAIVAALALVASEFAPDKTLHIKTADEVQQVSPEKLCSPEDGGSTPEQAAAGTCETCGKTDVPVRQVTIKDEMGTRYRKICEDCAEKLSAIIVQNKGKE